MNITCDSSYANYETWQLILDNVWRGYKRILGAGDLLLSCKLFTWMRSVSSSRALGLFIPFYYVNNTSIKNFSKMSNSDYMHR